MNPPGNPKAHYWTGGRAGEDPEQWLADAEKQQNSWWEAWADWVTARVGERLGRPEELGSDRYPDSAERLGSMYTTIVPA